jgi:hypothetical protein
MNLSFDRENRSSRNIPGQKIRKINHAKLAHPESPQGRLEWVGVRSFRKHEGDQTVSRLSCIFVVVVMFFAPTPSGARAGELLTFDSTWWSGLTADQQIYAVQGAIDGYESGFYDGQATFAAGLIAQSNALNKNGKLADADAVGFAALENKRQYPAFSNVLISYAHGISDFYANYPEASKATLGQVLPCLADTPRFTCAQIAKRIASQGP